ncbi:MAG: OB-fold putative lipoprotein [Acidobacteriota bacterium]|nr:OB-fold putative lipoprotein [Acidobacteriota bacterium]
MNRKSSLITFATVIALWLGIILGCGGSPQNRQDGSSSSSSSPSSSPSPSASPIPITALALASAYDDNEVAADQQYEGRELLVTGKVESIATVFGSTYVTLKGKEMSIVSVQCFVDDSQKGAVARLKKGTLATVQGTCDGKSLNVELKNCVIK